MMTNDPWLFADNVDPMTLSDARTQAHYAVQWLTRASRALLPAKDDDSHTNVGWDDAVGGFVTHDLPGIGGPFKIGLRISDLSLLISGAGDDVRIDLAGHSDAEIGTWLTGFLENPVGKRIGFNAPLPYDMPVHQLATGAAYDSTGSAAELGALSDWFANANRALGDIIGKMSDIKPGPSLVRCWPHHFDIATLISFDADGGENARSVGVGLSPGDDGYPQPYYYVSPWPYPDGDALPMLPKPFKWHTDGFTAAILTGRSIAEMDRKSNSVGELIIEATLVAARTLGKEKSE